jgi:NosR/NirI family nitrous oxide reductase transcriptional regulator
LVLIIFVIWTSSITLFDSYSPWNAFAQVDNFSESIFKYTGGFIILAAIAIGAVFIERFFCRYLCPLGAVFSILSKARIFKIKKIRDKCGKCRICTNNCSMGINLYKMDKVSRGEYINCFKCIDACPRKNAQASICGENVNPLLPGAIAIATFTGAYTLGGIMKDKITEYPGNTNGISASRSNLQQKKYKDGTYTGVGQGKSPNLKVSVKIKNNKIEDVKILTNNEMRGEEPFNVIPKEIIAAQSINVDAVSGATLTSKGIMMAVKDALSQATNKYYH